MAKVAVVIPFFQHEPGILKRAVQSVFAQRGIVNFRIMVVDDGSPTSAREELEDYFRADEKRITLIEQLNSGPGAARNRALDNIPSDTEFVAFLDSDDQWLPYHLERATAALGRGYDFYFSDFYFSDFKEKTAFVRAGKIPLERHRKLSDAEDLYEYVGDMRHQILIYGNVIGTSNVVYRYEKHADLRFREEFYNGQDYLFWLDFFTRGGRAIFSPAVECDCGVGVNIYAGAGWGTDRSLDRLRNELKLWSAVSSIYKMDRASRKSNDKKIRWIRRSLVRDILHRIAHRKSLPVETLLHIVRIDPLFPLHIPFVLSSILFEKLKSTSRLQ
jgi:succinoglycan biosynthesis protein ExoW